MDDISLDSDIDDKNNLRRNRDEMMNDVQHRPLQR